MSDNKLFSGCANEIKSFELENPHIVNKIITLKWIGIKLIRVWELQCLRTNAWRYVNTLFCEEKIRRKCNMIWTYHEVLCS
jgi:hypothetical protein